MSEAASTQRAVDRRLRAGIRRGRVGEAALVRAAQRGSRDAVEELFNRHWSGAYRAALLVTGDRAAAEDIAQEAFLSALRALPGFDLRRPLRPWLHRIVVNRAIDWSRARALRNEVGADVAAEPAAPDVAAEGVGDDVAAALMTLGPEQRAVVVMRYVLELTPGEIGAALGLPRGTVNSRLRRGLDALGVAIEELEA
jgi:RNA polymerase sigma-70 factor (ECF subfamily)